MECCRTLFNAFLPEFSGVYQSGSWSECIEPISRQTHSWKMNWYCYQMTLLEYQGTGWLKQVFVFVFHRDSISGRVRPRPPRIPNPRLELSAGTTPAMPTEWSLTLGLGTIPSRSVLFPRRECIYFSTINVLSLNGNIRTVLWSGSTCIVSLRRWQLQGPATTAKMRRMVVNYREIKGSSL